MKTDTVLDYAIFELSQKHSRCELFVSSNGETEKLASGLIEPFVNHLNVLATQSLFRAEVERNDNNGKSWFTRRTLERFVQFVNGPEVLERVNTFDSEMSQLEVARTLYSRDDDGGVPDATKNELLRAIDLRLEAITKDLTTSIAHASSNGFDPQTVSHLQRFADTFGAHPLAEACGKYMSLCERRPDLITKHFTSVNETNISQLQSSKEDEEEKKQSSTVKTSQNTRRLSVQDRINLFESKKTENSNSAGHKPVVIAKSTEPRRFSSDVPSAAPVVPEKSVLRRWSVVSDKEEGPLSTPSSGHPDATVPRESEENSKKSGDSQNQTDGDDLKKKEEEESYASKPHNVAQQQSFGVEDDLVNADSAGKIISNRVRATSVDQTQRARMSRDKNAVMRRNVSDLSYSDDSKGKLYEMYMKKRDAKLREESSSKQTKLKSMQEALERSRTEMKAKFSAASEKRHDSISSTRQRAEKLRSFNSRSSMKKFQHPISSLQSKEEDVQDKPSIGSQVRKAPPPNRSSRVSKPSGKVSSTNVTSGRGRRTPEISQSSVPSFSDLKKKNTKPSSLAVRNPPVIRTQVRSSSNKKTTKEEIPSPVKTRRPRSLRKSFSANIEYTEFTTLYSDDVVNKEMNQKQGSGIEDVPENLRKDEFDEMAEEEEKQVVEDPPIEEEEAREMDIHVIDEQPSLENSSSDDENVTSQIDLLPSTFQHNVGSLMDSPTESSLSWNSNLQHAFSYPQEHSDADDSSPMGSPSWSSRMRKKWGTTTTPAQSHVTISNSSPLHSRKDLAKGIKRLLKFGKKARPADSLMDWVSVTTSEGDDDEQGSFKAKDGEFKRSFFSLSPFRGKGNDSKPR
ncbi:hypothetical protein Bca52824_013004 [Brassica carinata]|uniref:COP1-interacting protein 7 n=1 Tax=Brassica carinata TaxID=52824 RepID=A0A8X7VXU8_BRACI|nr:hypothetical protein Bca52824_013004 [Brassica carinata]